MDLITGEGPSKRPRDLVLRRGGAARGAARIDDFKYRFIDQPAGWFGGTVKPDIPILVNLGLDPFQADGNDNVRRVFPVVQVRVLAAFVYVQQVVGKLAQTALDFPPMQKGASFNLEAVKELIQKAAQTRAGK